MGVDSAFGGWIASPTVGLAALFFAPLTMSYVAFKVSYWWFRAMLVLHKQVQHVVNREAHGGTHAEPPPWAHQGYDHSGLQAPEHAGGAMPDARHV